MDSKKERSYRKNLKLKGLIYFGREELEIIVKNLSLTGMFVELATNTNNHDIKSIFNTLKLSTNLDLYIPEMRLAGEVEVIRVDVHKEKVLLALDYKNLSFDVDPFLYNRKAYRKNLPGPGWILLNGEHHQFNAVNVSVDGLMIRIDKIIDPEVGTTAVFEFKQLELNGEIKIIWIEHPADNETLIGLQYLNLENKSINGIPRFSKDT